MGAGCRAWRVQGTLSSRARHAQAVERNVPHQLLPMSTRQVIGYLASDASLAKHRSKVMGARLRKALEFADDHQPVFDVVDQTRLQAVQTDKAEPAKNLFGAEQSRKLLFVSQAVLERQHRGPGAD